MSAPVLSWPFCATRWAGRHKDAPPPVLSRGALPPLAPRRPALRANPFPKVTDLFCRLPLPTFFYVTRGCSPWRPDAVMSTPGGANKVSVLGFSRAIGGGPDSRKALLLSRVPIPSRRTSRFQGVVLARRQARAAPLTRKDNSPRGPRWRLRGRLRHRTLSTSQPRNINRVPFR